MTTSARGVRRAALVDFAVVDAADRDLAGVCIRALLGLRSAVGQIVLAVRGRRVVVSSESAADHWPTHWTGDRW